MERPTYEAPNAPFTGRTGPGHGRDGSVFDPEQVLQVAIEIDEDWDTLRRRREACWISSRETASQNPWRYFYPVFGDGYGERGDPLKMGIRKKAFWGP